MFDGLKFTFDRKVGISRFFFSKHTTMSSEILSVLQYMEKEKGISRDDMIAAISNAIHTAALKGVNAGQELKIEINPRTGHLSAWSLLKVVDSVSDPKTEIPVERAVQLKPDAKLGETIYKEV